MREGEYTSLLYQSGNELCEISDQMNSVYTEGAGDGLGDVVGLGGSGGSGGTGGAS